jgi:2-polyprenyl-3-methyl-5-hydroxy-6-metoxy-1,4-benzoquinol methylase
MSNIPQLQTNNKTFLGRHWTEHSVLRRYWPSDKGLRVLSFGCATGEELVSLQLLFPGADLFGCDADWNNVQTARALLGKGACIFDSSYQAIETHGPYDVIVCNSVLLSHTVEVAGKKMGIDPGLWMEVVGSLDSVVKPGGIVQIINSNIPFRYHPVAASYRALYSPLILSGNFVAQFDPSNRHLCSGVGGTGWSAVVTRHLGEEGWMALQATDLRDIHFRKEGGPPIEPVLDEVIPTLPRDKVWASGTMTYRPQLDPDARPSTHTEIDVEWSAVAVDSICLKRVARRIWFDGSTIDQATTSIDMTGPAATGFIESATGRRSSRMTTDALFSAQPIRSPSF